MSKDSPMKCLPPQQLDEEAQMSSSQADTVTTTMENALSTRTENTTSIQQKESKEGADIHRELKMDPSSSAEFSEVSRTLNVDPSSSGEEPDIDTVAAKDDRKLDRLGTIDDEEEFLQKHFKDKSSMVWIDESEEEGFFRKHISKIAGCFLILCVVLTIWLAVSGDQDISNTIVSPSISSESPSIAPSTLSDFEFLQSLFYSVSGDTVYDVTSPQGRAMMLIHNESQSGIINIRERNLHDMIKERYALRVLYYSTQGDDWAIVDNNFTSTLPTCFWMKAEFFNRIKCNDQDEITDIFLNKNTMVGTLPRELAILTSLTGFSLAENSLSGSIPSSLGNLSNLMFLQLGLNRLEGSIPNSLTSLRRLERLILHANSLTGTLPSFWSEKFSRLRINQNKLNGTVPEFKTQTPLEWLFISDNNFSGTLPKNLSVQSNLVTLALSNNGFVGTISEDYGALNKLENFVLDNNDFSGTLPESLGSLTKIDWLWIDHNNLSGNLPENLRNMQKATEMKFSNNNFNGSLPSMWGAGLEQLTLLDISNNPNLEGVVPDSFQGMSDLETFALAGTHITGGLRDNFCDGGSPQLASLIAECGGDQPKIDCPCCTICCDRDICLESP